LISCKVSRVGISRLLRNFSIDNLRAVKCEKSIRWSLGPIKAIDIANLLMCLAYNSCRINCPRWLKLAAAARDVYCVRYSIISNPTNLCLSCVYHLFTPRMLHVCYRAHCILRKNKNLFLSDLLFSFTFIKHVYYIHMYFFYLCVENFEFSSCYETFYTKCVTKYVSRFSCHYLIAVEN